MTVILHTLNAGPGSDPFRQCLRIATGEDAILLTGDGVYAALERTEALSALIGSGAKLFVLAPDASAAGVVDRLGAQMGEHSTHYHLE